jgi:hypothetical protein
MTVSNPSIPRLRAWHASRLTKRSSQLRNTSRAGSLAVAMRTFDFMKQFAMFAALAAVSGR